MVIEVPTRRLQDRKLGERYSNLSGELLNEYQECDACSASGGTWDWINHVCAPGAPIDPPCQPNASRINGACVCYPGFIDDGSGNCVPGVTECNPKYHKDAAGKCVQDTCIPGWQLDDYGYCVEIPCPTGQHRDRNSGNCVNNVVDCGTGFVFDSLLNSCRPICANGYQWNGSKCACPDGYGLDGNGNCVANCGANQERINGNCVNKCPTGYQRDLSGNCSWMVTCPEGVKYTRNSFTGLCELKTCPDGSYLNEEGNCTLTPDPICGGGQIYNKVTKQCEGKVCDSGYKLDSYGNCVPIIPSCDLNSNEMWFGQCLPKCDTGKVRDSAGNCITPVCVPPYYKDPASGACVIPTGECDLSINEYDVNGHCVHKCGSGFVRDYQGNCVPSCDLTNNDLWNGLCKPKCGTGYQRDVLSGACVVNDCAPDQERINGVCVSKCAAGSTRINGVCVADCPAGSTRIGGVCVTDCPAGQTRVNGVCTPNVLTCPDGQTKDSAGNCVKIAGTGLPTWAIIAGVAVVAVLLFTGNKSKS